MTKIDTSVMGSTDTTASELLKDVKKLHNKLAAIMNKPLYEGFDSVDLAAGNKQISNAAPQHQYESDSGTSSDDTDSSDDDDDDISLSSDDDFLNQ